jgi:branched-chain amino acid aminotransferase
MAERRPLTFTTGAIATVIVECTPLPLRDRAHLYGDGIEVVTPSVRRTPPAAQPPRARSHNYLNLMVGDLEVRAQNHLAWAILPDFKAISAKGLGSNIFLVQDGALLTPRSKFVLPGVGRATVIERAGKLGISCREAEPEPEPEPEQSGGFFAYDGAPIPW